MTTHLSPRFVAWRPRTDPSRLLRDLATLPLTWSSQFRAFDDLHICLELGLQRYLEHPDAVVSLGKLMPYGRRVFVRLSAEQICAIDVVTGLEADTFVYHPPLIVADWIRDLKHLAKRRKLTAKRSKVSFISFPVPNLHFLAFASRKTGTIMSSWTLVGQLQLGLDSAVRKKLNYLFNSVSQNALLGYSIGSRKGALRPEVQGRRDETNGHEDVFVLGHA